MINKRLNARAQARVLFAEHDKRCGRVPSRRSAIALRRTIVRRPYYGRDVVHRALSLHAQGLHPREIARIVGISPDTLRNWLRGTGALSLRRNGMETDR